MQYMKTIVSLLGVATVLTATATVAFAAPKFVRISWDKSELTASSMVVSWNTSGSEPSEVQYGEDTNYGLTASGTSKDIGAPLGHIHHVRLENLKPSTTYHYRVGGQGAWSEDYTFHTGPKNGCSPFRFVALGDNRGDFGSAPSPHFKPILQEVMAHGPDFMVMTGDQVKDGDEADQWVDFLEVSEGASPYMPFMASLGNHDSDSVEGDAALYNNVFELPRHAPDGVEDYYYFRYGDALFVSLSMVSYTGGSQPYAEQAAWLDKVFTENPATWKFVYFHHPIFTGVIGQFFGIDLFEGNHPPNEKGQNAALVPIFDKHHVDIVFNGHNHFYQRYQPMIQGPDVEEGTPVDNYEDGTVYIITGGAGALTYDLSFLGLDLGKLICLSEGSVACSGLHHYVVVDVDGLDLHVKVMTSKSQLTDDNAPVEMIDEFWISKSGPEPNCDEPTNPDTSPEVVAEPVAAEVVEEPAAEEVVEETNEEEVTAEVGPSPADIPKQDTGSVKPQSPPLTEHRTTSQSKESSGCTVSGSSTNYLSLAFFFLCFVWARRRNQQLERSV